MNGQINVRMPTKLLRSAKTYSQKHGYDNLQDFIRETIREKLFERPTKAELALIQQLARASKKHNLYGTEEQLFKRLKK